MKKQNKKTYQTKYQPKNKPKYPNPNIPSGVGRGRHLDSIPCSKWRRPTSSLSCHTAGRCSDASSLSTFPLPQPVLGLDPPHGLSCSPWWRGRCHPCQWPDKRPPYRLRPVSSYWTSPLARTCGPSPPHHHRRRLTWQMTVEVEVESRVDSWSWHWKLTVES